MKPLKLKRVVAAICIYYEMDISEFYNSYHSRIRKYVKIRQIASYFFKLYTDLSLHDIGYAFNKDHATVLNSIKKVKNYIDTDKQFKRQIEELNDIIKPILTFSGFSVKRKYKIEEVFKMIELCFNEIKLEEFKDFYKINEDLDLK